MTPEIIVIDGETLAPLEAYAGDRLQMLVFSTTWCAPCKAMAAAIDDIATSYAERVAIAKVDIESSPGLAQRFAVRGVPTLVLRRADGEIDRHVGALTRTRLAMMLDGVLADAI